MADLDVDFGDAKESRFAHFLKPIRDMETCFNINIAHELKEYLEQLENAQFAFEGSRHLLVDFAEAALLIQGTVCVYSKKVEYLYTLTYQALETIKGRKRQQAAADGDGGQAQAGAGGRGAAVARGDDENEGDNLEYFWNVAPLLKESNDLDLAEGDGLMPNAGCSMRPPAVLLALEDQSQGAATSSSAKGDGDAGVYRLQQCVVHCSGALLLDPRDGDLYDQQLRYIGPQQRGQELDIFPQLAPLTLQQPATQAQSALNQQPAAQAQAQAQAQPTSDPTEPMDVGPPPAEGVDYDDDDGGGFAGGGDWPSDDEGQGAPPGAAGETDPMAVDGAAPGAAGDDGGVPEDAAAAAPRRAQPARAAATAAATKAGSTGEDEGAAEGQADGEAAEEEEFDPYKPLDPAEKNSRLADRPLLVRKPVRRKKNTAHSTARLGSVTAVAPGVGGLMLPEFGYFLAFRRDVKSEEETKADQRKKKPGCRALVERVELAGPIFDARDAAAAVAADEATAAEEAPGGGPNEPPQPAQQHPYGFEDDDDDGGGYGCRGGASDLDDDLDPALAGPSNPGGDGDSWRRPGVDEEGDPEGRGRLGRLGLWPGVVPPMGSLGGPEDGMAVDGHEPTYEELCRAHMESMLVAATAREVQSDMARRVSNWKQRIDPVLQAEEARPAFDIQDYGERLLGRLSNLKLEDKEQSPGQEGIQKQAAGGGGGGDEERPLVGFSFVAADLQQFEVPRMFSAMLQLINNRNIAICKVDTSNVPPGEVPDEPFQLQLLSSDMYHKTMGERLAALPPNQDGGGGATQPDAGDDEDWENRATQRARAKPAGGRGGKAGGGAKRAKKAAPLADANMEDD